MREPPCPFWAAVSRALTAATRCSPPRRPGASSPVRILRDENCQSPLAQGLYPCGEGAGYAGGIVSAAVDGLRCAEAVLQGN